jgi:hypothetical protein
LVAVGFDVEFALVEQGVVPSTEQHQADEGGDAAVEPGQDVVDAAGGWPVAVGGSAAFVAVVRSGDRFAHRFMRRRTGRLSSDRPAATWADATNMPANELLAMVRNRIGGDDPPPALVPD